MKSYLRRCKNMAKLVFPVVVVVVVVVAVLCFISVMKIWITNRGLKDDQR